MARHVPIRWLRIAHRGASGTAPEHTRPAFEAALALGVDMIELDVQLSRDEELIVIHDRELARTTSGHGCVRDYNLVELQQLDAGSWFAPRFAGQRILTLNDVFDVVGQRARLNVEIKAPPDDWSVLARRLIRVLRERQVMDATVISCFDMEALAAVRAQAGDARLGVLWQHTDFADAWRWVQDLRATSLHPFWMLASADVVDAAHARGVQLLTWTVNDVDVMQTLLARGVDGIMSDFPERFARVAAAASVTAP